MAWLGTLRPFQLFQVLVESVREKNLSTATLSTLHLHNHLTACHPDLMLLHALTSLFHLVDLFLVSALFSLALLPLFVGNACHDLHAFFCLLLFFIHLLLLEVFYLLLVLFFLLFDQTLLQPVFECFVPFFLLDLFLEAFLLFNAELLLFLECLSDQLAFFPLVHVMSALLVLLVQSGLLHNHFFKQVLLRFEKQDFFETLLMLFDAKPGVVVDLSLCKFNLIQTMHVKISFVLLTHLRLIFLSFEVNLRLTSLARIVGINVSLSGLIEAFKELLVYQVFSFLFFKIGFILFLVFSLPIRVRVFRLTLFSQVSVVLVSLFELSFLL